MNIYMDISAITEQETENDRQYYIYVLQNYPQGNIKIGRTRNPKQRLTSLSGSNNGGNKIIRFAISPMTYLANMEKTLHNHYNYARIDGTEYFDGNKITFEEITKYIDDIFNSSSYPVLNELRSHYNYSTY